MSLLHTFRYRVDFHTTTADDPAPGARPICSGRFSEVTGIEATMEPKAIAEGGRNWGEVQRPGRTTFATLVLKRGMTDDRGLWTWFQGVAGGGFAYRLNARLVMLGADQDVADPAGRLAWEFANCLPVKFKSADLAAATAEIGVEELHLAHEGLRLIPAGAP